MNTLSLWLACSTAQVDSPEQRVIDAVVPPVPSPEQAEKQIEAAAAPDVQAQLDTLRETVRRLHGPEVVDAIMAEVEAAKRASAIDLSTQKAAETVETTYAIQAAADRSKAETIKEVAP